MLISSTDRERAAVSVALAAGLASGVILGIEPAFTLRAALAVAILALIATCTCAVLLGHQLRIAITSASH
jgi:hypothetical protein